MVIIARKQVTLQKIIRKDKNTKENNESAYSIYLPKNIIASKNYPNGQNFYLTHEVVNDGKGGVNEKLIIDLTNLPPNKKIN